MQMLTKLSHLVLFLSRITLFRQPFFPFSVRISFYAFVQLKFRKLQIVAFTIIIKNDITQECTMIYDVSAAIIFILLLVWSNTSCVGKRTTLYAIPGAFCSSLASPCHLDVGTLLKFHDPL